MNCPHQGSTMKTNRVGDIVMPRGDIRAVSFEVFKFDEDGTRISGIELYEIYFTVKASYTNRDYLFQKRLSADNIESLGEDKYQFTIEPEDTDALKIGRYVFDIQLVGDGLKSTFVGDLILTEEATTAENEV